MSDATNQQQPPNPSDGDDVWLLVMADMEARRQFGIAKYGQPVRADNGRDHLVDVYQELLDTCVYIKAQLIKRERFGE